MEWRTLTNGSGELTEALDFEDGSRLIRTVVYNQGGGVAGVAMVYDNDVLLAETLRRTSESVTRGLVKALDRIADKER